MNKESARQNVKSLYFKVNEVLSLMKNGQFIVAYEKLGGVEKRLLALCAEMQKDDPEETSQE
jgi:hypothetical protein